jgi:polyisoprenyl-teichoic acid--peptidoglycan teichoic acid transferase
MFNTPDTTDEASSQHFGEQTGNHQEKPARRRHRPWRVALVTFGALAGLVVVAALGSYAYVNHTVSSIQRLRVTNLVAASSSSLDGETFVVTAYPQGPTGTTSQQAAQSELSNLVVLLHTNANGKGGGAVSMPGNVIVDVPGAGREPLWDTMTKSGPSLLVRTITQLTGLPVNHYARLDFTHIANLVDAVGGVDVTLPAATKGFGYTFVKGVNHLTGVTAIYYARDPAVTSQQRLLRQENLMRAVMSKIANDHLLINPITAVHVLKAITSSLAVDSNFTNSDIESLARQFGKLTADAATFVTVPTKAVSGGRVLNTPLADQLWTAVKHDSIAAFAKKYPSTVTPATTP